MINNQHKIRTSKHNTILLYAFIEQNDLRNDYCTAANCRQKAFKTYPSRTPTQPHTHTVAPVLHTISRILPQVAIRATTHYARHELKTKRNTRALYTHTQIHCFGHVLSLLHTQHRIRTVPPLLFSLFLLRSLTSPQQTFFIIDTRHLDFQQRHQLFMEGTNICGANKVSIQLTQ